MAARTCALLVALAVVALVFVVVVVERWDVALYVLGLGLFAVAGLMVTTWRRPRPAARLVPVLVFLVGLAFLRHAGQSQGGTGVAALILLPVLVIAVHGSRWELAAVIAAVVAFFVLPVILVGPPAYPTADLMTAAFVGTAAGGAGALVQQLVRQVRAHGQIALERQRDLERLLEVTRDIARAADVRAAVCEAARVVSGASGCALLERDDGGLTASASAGVWSTPLVTVAADEPLVATALKSGAGATITAAGGAHGRLLSALGDATFAVIEPVVGPDVAAVLVLGWHGRPPRRLETLPLLAAEAATAIARADLMNELQDLARIDPLTKLPNRRAWDEEFSRALNSAQRAGRPLSVAVLDLDEFKAFNDTYGHQAGDRLLHDVAAAWSDEVRTSDVLARWGGDEFALLLPEQTLAQTRHVIRRLVNSTPGCRVSVGAAEWDGSENGETLLARADRELYATKAARPHRSATATNLSPSDAQSPSASSRDAANPALRPGR